MTKYVCATALRASLAIGFIVSSFVTAASAQSVTAPWSARDVGSPTLRGSASQSSGAFTIYAAGTDIWNASDQFHFVYQQFSGDAEIVARVDSITYQHRWSKAGVMIRASLNGNAAHGLAVASAGMGVHFQRRRSTGATSLSTTGSSTADTPVWVRAVRVGNRITTYRSTNGTSWTTIGSDTITLGTSAYFGVAVTSHNTGARTTARVSNVAIKKTGLPSGQQSMDIGSPAIKGSATYSSGRYTIKGAGRDIWDTSDQFRYVYQPMTGNGEIVARVASLTNQDAWSKAGVMIREALNAQSRHAMVVTSVSKGYAFQRRPEPGGYTEHSAGGSGTAPGWVRLVRTGDLFEAYRSSTGTSWTRIGADMIAMGDTVYVGLAVTSHNEAAATTAVIDNVRISSSTGTNRNPAVSITAPIGGATFTAPATVAMTATATDPEGRMASVDFYAGSTLVARDTSAPYSASWSASTAGTFALTAVAHDADGGSSTSGAVSVTIRTGTTTTPPRAVAFTASSDHATNVTSYALKVFAASANPSTATAIATSNLGKPTPDSAGTITVDRATFFSNLAVGSYIATVTAVGPGGETQSSSVAFTR
ncbi:MAG: Ig-like domain-containing protein [Vicinamibacterales bacterium]